jgi:hypothetical protein
MLLLALTPTLTGCETSQEKSAKIEKVAKRQAAAAAKHRPRGLSIAHPSRVVRVGATVVLRSPEGTAAVIELDNPSSITMRNVPIAITVADAHGASVYTNTTPGLAGTLVSVPLLRAHSTSTWIDDQVQPSGVPASVHAELGEGERLAGRTPELSIAGAHLAEGQAEGTVSNHSPAGLHEVVVYAIARRGGSIVAAGRALLSELGPGASSHFQIFFIGRPQGAQLELDAVSSGDVRAGGAGA